MKVNVKFFAVYEELMGRPHDVIEVEDDLSVKDVFHIIMAHHSLIDKYLESTMFAVNLEYRSQDHILKDGDELAFIPPVAGG